MDAHAPLFNANAVCGEPHKRQKEEEAVTLLSLRVVECKIRVAVAAPFMRHVAVASGKHRQRRKGKEGGKAREGEGEGRGREARRRKRERKGGKANGGATEEEDGSGSAERKRKAKREKEKRERRRGSGNGRREGCREWWPGKGEEQEAGCAMREEKKRQAGVTTKKRQVRPWDKKKETFGMDACLPPKFRKCQMQHEVTKK